MQWLLTFGQEKLVELNSGTTSFLILKLHQVRARAKYLVYNGSAKIGHVQTGPGLKRAKICDILIP